MPVRDLVVYQLLDSSESDHTESYVIDLCVEFQRRGFANEVLLFGGLERDDLVKQLAEMDIGYHFLAQPTDIEPHLAYTPCLLFTHGQEAYQIGRHARSNSSVYLLSASRPHLPDRSEKAWFSRG